jgi:cytochrome c oxidase subunit 1
VLVTDVVDAEPSHRETAPGPSIGPLFTALAAGATIIACIFTPWGLVWGLAPATAALVGWYWPRRGEVHPENLAEVQP